MPRTTPSPHGGRHELGQNFLIHTPTLDLIEQLARRTSGPILEIGAGDGAITRRLAALGRPLVALELDAQRAEGLQRALPEVDVRCADALRTSLDASVLVGNIPFHLTTPILRRILRTPHWRQAILITQWEVARKRAGVGGGTLLTAQVAPWIACTLAGRVPARGFRPSPSVDGGILTLERRTEPLVPAAQRAAYAEFVRRVFTGPGNGLARVLGRATGIGSAAVSAAMREAGIPNRARPRDLAPQQWAGLWHGLAARPQTSRRGDALRGHTS
ncbi:Methylated-DNA--protein-cysteine methyltransferase [Leucobacter sp. 7(1)]|uniref:23S ribosomal RNA methyltransferase Erm n=1 Tax=Leucobacter sp. 7(1) TaxID=1255613 RepID=UPI00097F4F6C|nr:23S ribosomal RNA methyltransferase Erm [Leucobacter sp. 7(1)]SJN12746.1 Methylated-DNA--protein-cysteine methyltransferase [Leucobacter sp. 7(1)]